MQTLCGRYYDDSEYSFKAACKSNIKWYLEDERYYNKYAPVSDRPASSGCSIAASIATVVSLMGVYPASAHLDWLQHGFDMPLACDSTLYMTPARCVPAEVPSVR